MLFDSHYQKGRGSNATARVDVSSRVYAVGDVHGRHDLLLSILDKIVDDAVQFGDERRTRIVFLGDYIDRGDSGARVLETLIGLSTPKSKDVVLLRGNHEEALLTFLASPISGQSWLRYGALQTLADYGVSQPPRSPQPEDLLNLRDALLLAMGKHVDFLKNLPIFEVDGSVIFAHAGVDPRNLDDRDSMLWGHPAFLADEPLPGKLVVHGHYDGDAAVQLAGRICVDTGAYYSGCLTAVRLDDDISFLSVRSV